MRVCFECAIMAFSFCAWVPKVERLGSQTLETVGARINFLIWNLAEWRPGYG